MSVGFENQPNQVLPESLQKAILLNGGIIVLYLQPVLNPKSYDGNGGITVFVIRIYVMSESEFPDLSMAQQL